MVPNLSFFIYANFTPKTNQTTLRITQTTSLLHSFELNQPTVKRKKSAAKKNSSALHLLLVAFTNETGPSSLWRIHATAGISLEYNLLFQLSSCNFGIGERTNEFSQWIRNNNALDIERTKRKEKRTNLNENGMVQVKNSNEWVCSHSSRIRN